MCLQANPFVVALLNGRDHRSAVRCSSSQPYLTPTRAVFNPKSDRIRATAYVAQYPPPPYPLTSLT